MKHYLSSDKNAVQPRQYFKNLKNIGIIFSIFATCFIDVALAQIKPQVKPVLIVSPVTKFLVTDTDFAFRILNAPDNATYELWYSDARVRSNFLFVNKRPLPAPIGNEIVTVNNVAVPTDRQSGYTVRSVYTSTIPEIKNLVTTGTDRIGPGDKYIFMVVYDSSGNKLATSRSRRATENLKLTEHFDALNAFYVNRAGQNIVDYASGSANSGYVRAAGDNFTYLGEPYEDAGRSYNDDFHGNPRPWLYHIFTNSGHAYGGYGDHWQNVGGGWFDAGDQGKYTVNGATALWHLFNLIERDMPFLKTDPNSVTDIDNAQRNFWRNEYQTIPADPKALMPGSFYSAPKVESATELPNLVKEARYQMEWLLRMQVGGDDSNPDNAYYSDLPVGNQDIAYDAGKGYGVKFAEESPAADYAVDKFSINQLEKESAKYGNFLIDPHTRKEVKLRKQTISLSGPYDIKGMVLHSVHDDEWTTIPMLPANNHKKRVYEYPTTAATLSLAAIAAQCYRVFQKIDPIFASKCLKASDLAFKVGFTNKSTDDGDPTTDDNVYFYGEHANAEGGSSTSGLSGPLPSIINGGGAYADNRIDDLVYWARMERFITYSKMPYPSSPLKLQLRVMLIQNLFLDMACQNGLINKKAGIAPFTNNQSFPAQSANWLLAYNWANNAALGTISAVTAYPELFAKSEKLSVPCNGVAKSIDSPAKTLISYANTLAGRINSNSWGLPIQAGFNYEWGSNHELANAAILAGVAIDIAKKYPIANLQLNADVQKIPKNVAYHLLGANALGLRMVTSQSDWFESANNIHHRVFAREKDFNSVITPSGWLVGGPNGQLDQAVLSAARFNFENTADQGVFNKWTIKNDADNKGGYEHVMSVLPNCRDRDSNGNAIMVNKEPITRSSLCHANKYWSYHTNEVAINWQASWLWLSSYLAK